jgi:hypothetical protein
MQHHMRPPRPPFSLRPARPAGMRDAGWLAVAGPGRPVGSERAGTHGTGIEFGACIWRPRLLPNLAGCAMRSDPAVRPHRRPRPAASANTAVRPHPALARCTQRQTWHAVGAKCMLRQSLLHYLLGLIVLILSIFFRYPFR